MHASVIRLLAALLVSSFSGFAMGANGAPEAAQAAPLAPLRIGLDRIEPRYEAGARFRSPATIDDALVKDLADRLHRPVVTVARQTAKADLAMTVLDPAAVPVGHVVVPVGYFTGAMAIMRRDTDIERWQQLKGRTVCVVQGARHAGVVASRHGAVEQLYPSLTDALVALRTGRCDAAVHDNTMLEELIKLPEWKKFSAYLPAAQVEGLAFIIPAANRQTIATVRQVTRDWRALAYPQSLVNKAVRTIAFEVYLEQEVPDCH